MKPSAAPIEVAKQKAAGRGHGDWRACLLERAVTATRDIARGSSPPEGGAEAAALLAGFRRLMANGEARARGRKGSLLGLEQDLSAELWNHLEVRGDGTLEVPGSPPIRFYRVVIQLGNMTDDDWGFLLDTAAKVYAAADDGGLNLDPAIAPSIVAVNRRRAPLPHCCKRSRNTPASGRM